MQASPDIPEIHIERTSCDRCGLWKNCARVWPACATMGCATDLCRACLKAMTEAIDEREEDTTS